MCFKCEIGICKKTVDRENPKPYRTGNSNIHGLICCKNGCGYWNRDVRPTEKMNKNEKRTNIKMTSYYIL